MVEAPRLSIVVPVYNEAQSLSLLYEEISEALIGQAYEVVFVDDGSTDASPQILEDLTCRYPQVRVIRFERNFGKADALAVGFKEARGEIVVTMDGDLQDDPAQILYLLQVLEGGYDLVSGWKLPRRDPWTKRLASWLFNLASSWLSGTRFHDINSGFKACRRRLVEEVPIYGGHYRFMPILAHWKGFAVTEVVVAHRQRRYGRSKYGMRRFVGGFLDLLTVLFLIRFRQRPLHIFGTFGLACLALGLGINLYLTLIWLRGEAIGHRPLLILGVLLMVMGAQFLSMGLLGEMIAHAGAPQQELRVYRVLEPHKQTMEEASPLSEQGR